MIENLIFVSTLMVLFFFAALFIPALLTKRAAYKVIDIFCRYEALNPKKAKDLDELGLRPLGFFERIGRMRDYKPYALQALKQAKVVRTTKDGRLYMAQENLNENLRCDVQPGS